MAKQLNKRQTGIEKIIQRAVKEALAAGRAEAERKPSDAYRATGRRLYALPMLIKKVEDARDRLEDLLSHGPQAKSKDVVRLAKNGVRLSADEIVDALVTDIRASIAADENEIAIIKKLLKISRATPIILQRTPVFTNGQPKVKGLLDPWRR